LAYGDDYDSDVYLDTAGDTGDYYQPPTGGGGPLDDILAVASGGSVEPPVRAATAPRTAPEPDPLSDIMATAEGRSTAVAPAPAPDIAHYPPDAPTYGGAFLKELKERAHGLSALVGTAALQPSRWLPEGTQGGILKAAQDLARERSTALGEALPSVPGQMAYDVGKSFIRPGETFKHEPLTAIESWGLPFSFASGVLRASARAAGYAGKAGTAAKLSKAAEAVSPASRGKQAFSALERIPGVRPYMETRRMAMDAQRTIRRETLKGVKVSHRALAELDEWWKAVPVADQARMVDIAEGTLDAAQMATVSPQAKAFLHYYRDMKFHTERDVSEALARASTDPSLAYTEHRIRFDEARWKPLAEKLSFQRGVKITAPEAHKEWQLGLHPHITEEPIHFPHKDIDRAAHPEKGVSKVRSVRPGSPGSLKVRTGGAHFDHDFMRVAAEHEKLMQHFIARSKTTTHVYETQGVALGGLKTDRDVADALEQLQKATGIRHIASNALNDHLAHKFLQASGIVLPDKPNYYAIPEATKVRLLEEMEGVGEKTRVWEGVVGTVWKAPVLAYNPAWHAGNLAGNVILTTLAARFNPGLASKLRAAGAIPEDIATASIHAQSKMLEMLANEELAKMRFAEQPVGKMAVALQKSLPGRSTKKLTEFLYNANSAVDAFAREATFASKIKGDAIQSLREAGISGWLNPKRIEAEAIKLASDPVTAQKAVDFVNKFYGNYFDLTPFERKVVRNWIFPFWSWEKSMAKLAISLPITHPGRSQMLQQVSKLALDAKDDPYAPQEIQGGKLAIQQEEDGRTMYADFRNWVPFANRFEGNVPSMAPWVMWLAATATGTGLFGHTPTPPGYVEAQGRLYDATSGEYPPREVDWGERSWMAGGQAVKDTFRNMPPVKLGETLLAGETPRAGSPLFSGKEDDTLAPFASRQSLGQHAFSRATGINVRSYQPDLATKRHFERTEQAFRSALRKEAVRSGPSSVEGDQLLDSILRAAQPNDNTEE
jgi:hypothetical protein